jgi:hypothetical protein
VNFSKFQEINESIPTKSDDGMWMGVLIQQILGSTFPFNRR